MLTDEDKKRNRAWGQKVAEQAPEWTPEELAALRVALRPTVNVDTEEQRVDNDH